MGIAEKAIVPLERRRWEGTYNNLVHLLRSQQIQLETLLRERKLFERRIMTQNERWASFVRISQDQIFQMKHEMALEEQTRKLQTVKSNLMTGLTKREVARLKLMLDYADSEFAEDHKNVLVTLKQKSSQPTDSSKGNAPRSKKKKGFKSEDNRSKALESEVIELRKEYDKLLLKKNAEVSALLLEKDFVWHKLKTLEKDYADKLRKKTEEVENANEKIANLIAKMEELQSSNGHKDKTIQALESKIAKMQADAVLQRNQMSSVKYQLETLKKSTKAAASPSLRRCLTESMKSNLESNSNKLSKSHVRVKKERKSSNLADHSEKGSTGLKRKMIDFITIPDTPKLFSASFKAPKLKQSSPSVNAP